MQRNYRFKDYLEHANLVLDCSNNQVCMKILTNLSNSVLGKFYLDGKLGKLEILRFEDKLLEENLISV